MWQVCASKGGDHQSESKPSRLSEDGVRISDVDGVRWSDVDGIHLSDVDGVHLSGAGAVC